MSIGLGSDPSVLAVSLLQLKGDLSHKSSDRLPLLSARPAVTLQAKEDNCPGQVPNYTAETEAHM